MALRTYHTSSIRTYKAFSLLDQGYLKVLKEERKEPFFARMSKKLMISESEE